ncbi:MAG TPA: hypothetical protein VGM93_02335, partial [Acidimicrobiales bacterium]
MSLGIAKGFSLGATDADSGDPFTFANSALAGLSCNAAGACTYTPSASSPTSTSFTFTANDGTSTSPSATVTLNIVNDAPTGADVAAVDAHLGETVRAFLPVADVNGLAANSTGAGQTLTVTPGDSSTGTTLTCGSFAADGSARTGSFACSVAVAPSAALGAWSASYTVTDGLASSASYTVSGTLTRRAAPSGALVCKDSAGTVVTSVDTGSAAFCSVTFTDAIHPVGSPDVNGRVISDAPISPDAASVSLSSSLDGSDFFDATTGALADSTSCTLVPGTGSNGFAVGSAGCTMTSPVVFRSAGSSVLTTVAALAADSTHGAAGSTVSGPLSATASCVPSVFDGQTLAAPAGSHPNDGQFHFYAYNLKCAATPSLSSDQLGYAYDAGPDPDLGGADAYFTATVDDVGADGFASWAPQVYTDPGESVALRFFAKTSAQSPDEYTTLDGLSVPTDVQWLSDQFTISISGVRVPPTLGQTILFPTFPAGQDTTVTLAATSSVPSLTVSYAITAGDGTACTLDGNQLTFGTTIGAVCTVQASQPGDGLYFPAPLLTRSVTVTKAAQTIMFPTPSGPTYVGGHMTLTSADVASQWTPSGAPVGTGMPVTMSASGGCSLDSSTVAPGPSPSSVTVTFKSFSSCRVTAKQAGDSGFSAATPAVWNFDIVKVPQAITFNHPPGSVGGPLNRFLVGDHLVLTSSDLFAGSGLPVSVTIAGVGCTAQTGTVGGEATVQIDFSAPGS